MKSGKTRIFNVGGSKVVTIPVSVFKDGTFPFKRSDELNIKINKNCLTISKDKLKK